MTLLNTTDKVASAYGAAHEKIAQKHTSIDEIYKEAGFDKESANLAPLGEAAGSAWNTIKGGVSAFGKNLKRTGGAFQREAHAAGDAATLGQKAKAVGGQVMTSAGRFAQNNPGAAMGIAGGAAAAGIGGAGAVAGRMTAPRQ